MILEFRFCFRFIRVKSTLWKEKRCTEGCLQQNNGILEPFCEQSEQNVSRAGLSEGQWERVIVE